MLAIMRFGVSQRDAARLPAGTADQAPYRREWDLVLTALWLAVFLVAVCVLPVRDLHAADREAEAVEKTPVGAEPSPALKFSPPAATIPEGPADFDTCAQLALRQSPYITKSAIDIEVSRLDESDSRFGLTPKVTFRTQYYITRPDNISGTNKRYFIQFNSNEYNPLGSYFALQASKLFTQIAILGHMKVISEGLHKLAKSFLELAALKQLADLQGDYITLAGKNLEYVRQRSGLGDANKLELQLATQEVRAAEAEKASLGSKQKKLAAAMTTFLGIPKGGKVNFLLKNAREQVVQSFDPAAATSEEVRSRSFDMRIQALKRELQSWNVALAKSRLLPNLYGSVQTPDPLSGLNDGGLYFYVGLSIPVWDGFDRLRNVSRQKNILRQLSTDMNVKESDVSDKWQESQDLWQTTAAALKLAQTQLEIARLKERQAEIRYHSGGEPLTTLIEGQKARLEAQKVMVTKTLESDVATLEMRYLAGDLIYSYVDEKSWQR